MTIFEGLAVARDWALIWLAVLGFVLSLMPLYLLFKAAQGLGRLLPQVVPTMRRWRGTGERILAGVERGMAATSAPFVRARSTGVGLRASLGNIGRRFTNGR